MSAKRKKRESQWERERSDKEKADRTRAKTKHRQNQLKIVRSCHFGLCRVHGDTFGTVSGSNSSVSRGCERPGKVFVSGLSFFFC